MKDMFDRCYYPCLGRLEGRPYATIICAGSDGDHAQRQLDRIATRWRRNRVAVRVIVHSAAQTPQATLPPEPPPPHRPAQPPHTAAAPPETTAPPPPRPTP